MILFGRRRKPVDEMGVRAATDWQGYFFYFARVRPSAPRP